MPQTAQCNNTQKVPVSITPTADDGSDAPVDGGLQAERLSGDGTFEQDPSNPNAGFFVSGTELGDTVYRLHADVDMGTGTVDRDIDVVTLQVGSPQATQFGLTLGAPVPK